MITKIKYDFPKNFRNDKQAIIFLSNLWYSSKNRRNTTIILDFSSTRSFDTNLCSPLGMILEYLKEKQNLIYFSKLQESILKKLTNNNFLTKIQVDENRSCIQTHISYKSFKINEKEKFERYIWDELIIYLRNNGINNDCKDFVKAIMEMFVNIKMHTNSRNTKTCGYYLPENNEIYFTLCNLGVTIKKNIELANSYIFDQDHEAIDWAVKKNKSTRSADESGGLGFYTTRNFVKKYDGIINVISGRGYWEECNGQIISEEMKSAFPGTIITFRINLNNFVKEKTFINKDTIGLEELIGGGLWNA
ncbi:hypothetical protein [Clostridium grantii]|uniref:Uncharacterized protein n=1 Tax=Clostridium grantii DSM 8605 TaxID=1121316 RepID=A0A1M5RCN3_9CLOT|nr:hypothetical protein [Clostridium grantii]SHH24097.1 hypothetical protein SAMN02745207_00460 [Clostridium grantii DSM 8605]